MRFGCFWSVAPTKTAGCEKPSYSKQIVPPLMNSPLILRTVDLRKRFGGVAAVDGVDFTLSEGELRCVIGPNGAGKSTFFKMLSGQFRRAVARFVPGRDITGEERFRIARRGVAIKTQVPSVYDELPVDENIRLSAARKQTRAGTQQTVAKCWLVSEWRSMPAV